MSLRIRKTAEYQTSPKPYRVPVKVRGSQYNVIKMPKVPPWEREHGDADEDAAGGKGKRKKAAGEEARGDRSNITTKQRSKLTQAYLKHRLTTPLRHYGSLTALTINENTQKKTEASVFKASEVDIGGTWRKEREAKLAKEAAKLAAIAAAEEAQREARGDGGAAEALLLKASVKQRRAEAAWLARLKRQPAAERLNPLLDFTLWSDDLRLARAVVAALRAPDEVPPDDVNVAVLRSLAAFEESDRIQNQWVAPLYPALFQVATTHDKRVQVIEAVYTHAKEMPKLLTEEEERERKRLLREKRRNEAAASFQAVFRGRVDRAAVNALLDARRELARLAPEPLFRKFIRMSHGLLLLVTAHADVVPRVRSGDMSRFDAALAAARGEVNKGADETVEAALRFTLYDPRYSDAATVRVRSLTVARSVVGASAATAAEVVGLFVAQRLEASRPARVEKAPPTKAALRRAAREKAAGTSSKAAIPKQKKRKEKKKKVSEPKDPGYGRRRPRGPLRARLLLEQESNDRMQAQAKEAIAGADAATIWSAANDKRAAARLNVRLHGLYRGAHIIAGSVMSLQMATVSFVRWQDAPALPALNMPVLLEAYDAQTLTRMTFMAVMWDLVASQPPLKVLLRRLEVKARNRRRRAAEGRPLQQARRRSHAGLEPDAMAKEEAERARDEEDALLHRVDGAAATREIIKWFVANRVGVVRNKRRAKAKPKLELLPASDAVTKAAFAVVADAAKAPHDDANAPEAGGAPGASADDDTGADAEAPHDERGGGAQVAGGEDPGVWARADSEDDAASEAAATASGASDGRAGAGSAGTPTPRGPPPVELPRPARPEAVLYCGAHFVCGRLTVVALTAMPPPGEASAASTAPPPVAWPPARVELCAHDSLTGLEGRLFLDAAASAAGAAALLRASATAVPLDRAPDPEWAALVRGRGADHDGFDDEYSAVELARGDALVWLRPAAMRRFVDAAVRTRLTFRRFTRKRTLLDDPDDDLVDYERRLLCVCTLPQQHTERRLALPQAQVRGFLARRLAALKRRQRAGATELQRVCRGWYARHVLLPKQRVKAELRRIRRRVAATAMQRLVRGWVAAAKYRRTRNAAILMEALFRGKKARMIAARKRLEKKMATKIQALARGWLFRRQWRAAVVVQARLRRWLCMTRYKIARRAIITIQALARGRVARLRARKLRSEKHRNFCATEVRAPRSRRHCRCRCPRRRRVRACVLACVR